MKHHDDAIGRYVAVATADPDTLAIVLTGSVARGDERPDSDIDIDLVVTEEAFERALAQDRVSYVTGEGVDYEDGYIDVKVASIPFLERAVHAADEPMRASFLGAKVLWTCDDRIGSLVEALPRLDDEEFDRRARSFVAQARLQAFYFLVQGVEHENALLTHHAAVHLAYAVGRALLAHNRRLFQGPKYLEQTVAQLPQAPERCVELMKALVQTPSIEAGNALLAALESYHDWNLGYEDTLSTFVTDNELAWFTAISPPEYR
jgi:predicted nucleotidyltransferase